VATVLRDPLERMASHYYYFTLENSTKHCKAIPNATLKRACYAVDGVETLPEMAARPGGVARVVEQAAKNSCSSEQQSVFISLGCLLPPAQACGHRQLAALSSTSTWRLGANPSCDYTPGVAQRVLRMCTIVGEHRRYDAFLRALRELFPGHRHVFKPCLAVILTPACLHLSGLGEARGRGGEARMLAAPSADCHALADTWKPGWADRKRRPCAEWAANRQWGALKGGARLAGACASAWAREQCARTCCTRAGVVVPRSEAAAGKATTRPAVLSCPLVACPLTSPYCCLTSPPMPPPPPLPPPPRRRGKRRQDEWSNQSRVAISAQLAATLRAELASDYDLHRLALELSGAERGDAGNTAHTAQS
jgi:hypothetical protein